MIANIIVTTDAVAVQALSQTITFLCKAGRFRQAADREKEIAQIYLADGVMGKACESYQRAGDWYAQEDASAYVNNYRLMLRGADYIDVWSMSCR